MATSMPSFTGTLHKYVLNPGKLYNGGNWLALSAAIVQPLWLSFTSRQDGHLAILAYFFGSLPAVATTLGTMAFFYGGHWYTKAWSNGFPPLVQSNHAGDFWSGLGALSLGLGMISFANSPVALIFALVGTLLHAGGKWGSALGLQHDHFFKMMPLLSRVPYLASLVLDLARFDAKDNPVALVLPLTLVFCSLLWATADSLLMPKTK